MHYHYFILQKIAALIQKEVTGGIFAEAFTQEKDQIVLGFGNADQDLWLRVSCGPPLPFVWPVKQYNKARKNVKMLFEQIAGLKILNVKVVPYERVIVIALENAYRIVLKMHGVQSNVLVMQHNTVIDRFRQNADSDLEFVPEHGEYVEAALTDPSLENLPVPARLRAISPVFEKSFAAYVERQMAAGMGFREALEKCIAAAQDDFYYVLRRPNRMQLLLFDPGEGDPIRVEGLWPALNLFLKSAHQYQGYARVYEQVRKPLEKHVARYKGQIASFYESIFTIANERPPEEMGHILMANLHSIEVGAKEVELLDFYHDRPIVIKLKPELNPQQNAEQYYQKQKKHRSRVKHLEEQILRLEAEWVPFLAAKDALDKFPTPEQLVLTADGLDHSILRAMNAFANEYLPLIETGKAENAQQKHGFVEYQKEGYMILCGKNAKQNDALTFAYSRKDDLWLHARDTTGSHVIIRNPTAGPIPNAVLEYAAGIAAFYSKRKHESLVPVQYTERKYVRKVKNGAPGAVIVEREKVVMIPPKSEK
jgi:predicted ribosome quality control (RQC) complex YloA/Tae2 family protein